MLVARRNKTRALMGKVLAAALLSGGISLTAACATQLQTPPVSAVQQLETFRVQVRAQRARIESKIAEGRDPALALYVADLAFNDDAAKRGLQAAFADWFAQDGVLVGAGAPPAFGPVQVAATYKGSQDWTLQWAPVDARIEGNLGVTWGIAALSLKDDKGQLIARSTRYVTVWTRQADGSWKVWLDTGTTGPLPALN